MLYSSKFLQYYILFILLFLGACKAQIGSMKDKSVDFSNYHTFAWEINPAPPIKNTLYDTDIFQNNLILYSTRELEKKGYIQDGEKPDLILKYRIVVEDKKKTVAENNFNNTMQSPYYFRPGYGFYPYGGYYGNRGMNNSNTTYKVVKYKEGSLMIDVIDKKDNRLIWQGFLIEELDTPDSLEDQLSTYVKKIFSKYPKH